MIDLNELTKKELIKEGDFVRVKLRQNTSIADGVIKDIGESYISVAPLPSDGNKEIEQQLSELFDNRTLDYNVLDRSIIEYIAVMKKVEPKDTNEEQDKS